jgi:replicative DNA helicase
MTRNATPRRQPGTRQDQSSRDYNRLIAAITPRPDLAADYVVLAAMLHCPDLAAPHVSRLHPGDWATVLHQIIARIALAHLRTIGRVDHRQLGDVLHDAGTVRPDSVALERATLARVAELIHVSGIVEDAVAVLTADRRGAAA